MPKKLSMPPDELRKFIRDNAGKMTSYAMEIETGCARNTIINYASEMGVSVQLSQIIERRVKIDKALTDHHKEMNCYEIARLVGASHTTVYNRSRILGLAVKNGIGSKNEMVTENGFFNYKQHRNWLV